MLIAYSAFKTVVLRLVSKELEATRGKPPIDAVPPDPLNPDQTFSLGGCKIWLNSGEVENEKGERKQLTPRAWEVLRFLVEDRRRFLTHAIYVNEIARARVQQNALANQICILRKYYGVAIVHVLARGYRI